MSGCWAEIVSPCDGKISREHYISDATLPETVEIKGFDWCKTDFSTIGKSNLVAKILCRKHNSALSECDAEAKLLLDALPRFFAARDTRRKQSFTQVFEINGFRFARWICKTFCGLKAAAKKRVDVDFARYSFGVASERRLHFYIIAMLGRSYTFDPKAKSFNDFSDPEGRQIFVVGFHGFTWIASSIPLHAQEKALLKMNGIDLSGQKMMNRCTEMNIDAEKPKYGAKRIASLRLSWDDEPEALKPLLQN